MSAGCSSQYVNAGCQCLTDPMDITSSICGYINKKNGLVYPCDLGCCIPACTNVGVYPIFNQDLRPSTGAQLPPGFNINLPQVETPSEISGAAPFSSPETPSPKVWQIVFTGFVFLVLILLSMLALKAQSHG
jgi:hypothetical protein